MWIGDYTIYSIVPMNYSSRERYTSISLSLNNLNENAKIHHRLDNENWFYDFDHNESNLFSVKSSDIDQVDIETLSLNDMKEKRYDSIYIEIETWEMPEEPIYIMSKTPIISDILDKADKPIKPEKPVEPNKPIEPVKPVIPDKPVEAVKPVGADKPKEPDDRARQMVE